MERRTKLILVLLSVLAVCVGVVHTVLTHHYLRADIFRAYVFVTGDEMDVIPWKYYVKNVNILCNEVERRTNHKGQVTSVSYDDSFLCRARVLRKEDKTTWLFFRDCSLIPINDDDSFNYRDGVMGWVATQITEKNPRIVLSCSSQSQPFVPHEFL